MKDTLIYITEVALCLNLLYWVYRQFLAELSFFSWSRFFFVSALLIAFAVPTFDLPLMPMKVSPQTFFAYTADESDRIYYFHNAPSFEPNTVGSWTVKLIFGAYVVGLLWFILKIARNLAQIYLVRATKGANGVRVAKSQVPAWSFFNRIIINQDVEQLEESERQQVIVHEKTHAKQLHSIDTLLVETATAILWFNPLMPKIKREIVSLHEYMADHMVSKQYNAQEYSRLILKLAGQKQKPILGTAFTNQIVGDRISMLNRPPQSELKKLRFLLVLPLIAVLLMTFSLIEHVVLKEISPASLSNSQWEFPMTKRFSVVKPFSKSEKLSHGNIVYHLSHKRVTLVAEAHQKVIVPSDAKVLNVWKNNKSGVYETGVSLQLKNDLVFVIEGLSKAKVKRGQQLKRGDQIGTTGKNELYPTLSFELWDKGKRIDPLTLYE